MPAPMYLHFQKLIQFSRLMKAGDRVREFNFLRMKSPDESAAFSINVVDDRGNRIAFNMEKIDNDWKIIGGVLPSWITQNENRLHALIERELSGEGMPDAGPFIHSS
jgi:hypothetical protein